MKRYKIYQDIWDRMPYISVLIEEITLEQQKNVVKLYNDLKGIGENPLEILDRAERGFCIKYDLSKDDSNNNIKQLRWSRGRKLLSGRYLDFDYDEKWLLCSCLRNVLGDENVIWNE
jgi:hypothetical protein